MIDLIYQLVESNFALFVQSFQLLLTCQDRERDEDHSCLIRMAVLLFGRCKQLQGLKFKRRSTLLHFDVVEEDRRLATDVSISSDSVSCDDLSDDESESVRLRFPPVDLL